jgi:excisionase family DNA binding protein
MSNNTHEAKDRPTELLTKAELAKRLNVTSRTIDNWRDEKILSAYKIMSQVRFDWGSVLAELELHKEGRVS